MKSIATRHFPQIRFAGGRKWLFNPILKKRFKNRPEERVRLKWIEYLLHQTDWKKTRIGFETPVKLHQHDNLLRTDLLLFTDQMEPYILVESKAESVVLNDKTAEQAARYNSHLDAPYVTLTNGIEDFWFQSENGKIAPCESPLIEVRTMEETVRQQQYWSDRGFHSADSPDNLKKWLEAALHHFWDDQTSWSTRYLAFKDSFLPIPMDHYYRVAAIDTKKKIAVGFLGAPQTPSYLTAILNSSGTNSGVLMIDLDAMNCHEPRSARRYTGSDEKFFDANKVLPASFLQEMDPLHIENLPYFLMRFFD